jgi:hypothetical protein
MRYQQKFWSVDMPKGWTYQEAGHSVAFFNPEGVGAFNVSAYQKSAPVSDLDLRELADSAQLSEVNAGNASGFACRLVQSNEFLMKWWLRSANVWSWRHTIATSRTKAQRRLKSATCLLALRSHERPRQQET